MRIVIDVRGLGATGYEVAAALREDFDIHVELATHATIVLVLGIGELAADLGRFAHDFAHVTRYLRRSEAAAAVVRGRGALHAEVVRSPREAFLGAREVVPVEEAIGRISAESIAGYPPGIPALLPGERITEEVVAYLRELQGAGARLHGASDPAFATLNVLA